MTEQLKGKVALVTGAGSGIGRATAELFAREGARVVVADIDVPSGEQTVTTINDTGGEAIFIRTDVSQSVDVQALIAQIIETYGRLDCACNNAGLQGDEVPTAECSEENWDYVIAVNLKGVWLCMKYEIIEMLKTGGGAIVNMSSVNAFTAWRNLPPYVASKHAINGLTKVAAIEYASKGIRINAVAPGTILTPMNVSRLADPVSEANMVALSPIGRLGTPEEIAEAVVWLCTDAASYVVGHCLLVDGGFIIP